MTETAYLIFFRSTSVFMKRGGYDWVGSILTGIFSPIAFIILFTIILLPTQLIIGKSGISEESLSSESVGIGVTVFIVLAWCVSGYFLSGKKSEENQDSNSDLPTAN